MAAVVMLLAALCLFFPSEGLMLGSKNLRFASISKVIAPKETIDLDSLMAAREAELEEVSNLHDSILYYENHIDSSELRFWFPDDDPTFFDAFFTKAENAQKEGRIIRILHYGDSQIEMDRISCRLRIYMQNHFGGGGPGMQPIHPIIPSYAVNEYATGSLALQTCFGDSLALRAHGNYGPMVQCFRLSGSSSTDFRSSTHNGTDAKVKQFSTIRLLFNNRPGPISATLSDRQHHTDSTQQNSMEGVGMMCWHLDSASNSVKIRLNGTSDIYGVMLDDGPGVAVDNIPMRGCSGQQFTKINRDQLTAAYSNMDVGLIILQFGGNSVPYLRPGKSIETYCNAIGKEIDYIRQCCPNSLILFVGPSDMSTSVSGQLQTYPAMETIIEQLRLTANAHGAAYWSIYHAMGGANSMLAWVGKGWAGSDYIHFSPKGADIMGDLMADAFDRIYTYYKLRHSISDSQQQILDSLYEK